MNFVTDRLSTREFIESDAEDMELVFGDPEVMQFSDNGVLSAQQTSKWITAQIRNYTTDTRYGRWAIALRKSRSAIGYFGLTDGRGRTERGDVELGIRLARRYWGQGYASELGHAIINAALQRPTTERVVAIVDPNNHQSVRLLVKVGMTYSTSVEFEGYDYPDHVYAIGRPPAQKSR